MNGLQVFRYREHSFHSMMLDGQPWFILRDVCQVLDLGSPHKVAERLDPDERNQIPVTDNLGRLQNTTIINESGLYAVILRSDKPEAKPFRKWVTAEVLPTIRRTGGYAAPQRPEDRVLELMEELMQARQENADMRVAAAQKEAEELRLELEFALGHDESSERKRAQARERVRKYRESQRQEKAAQQ